MILSDSQYLQRTSGDYPFHFNRLFVSAFFAHEHLLLSSVSGNADKLNDPSQVKVFEQCPITGSRTVSHTRMVSNIPNYCIPKFKVSPLNRRQDSSRHMQSTNAFKNLKRKRAVHFLHHTYQVPSSQCNDDKNATYI